MSHPADDSVLSASKSPALPEILSSAKLKRRAFLRGALAAGAAAVLGSPLARRLAQAAEAESTLGFLGLPHGLTEGSVVPPGYIQQVLIRWGDPLFKDSPAFDPRNLTADAQRRQFGYNCDYLSFLPRLINHPEMSDKGILCVNQEYTIPHLMFPGIEEKTSLETVTREQADVEIAAHGHAVVEVFQYPKGGPWTVNVGSIVNRRITADTPMRIAGPAAGHARMKTSADPRGERVLGTLANCAGGTTPWGTILIAEENFDGYFMGDPEKSPEARALKRYGFGKKVFYNWGKYYDRFHMEKEPNEPNRFGWVVEFDPYNANSTPVKRTSLGRFKHEGAANVISSDGRLVVYMGDDERFDYLYKWVSAGKIDLANRRANMDLLDDGTLYVAKFSEDYSVRWLALKWGAGPLTASNGFASQADVLIETRRASDLLGATPMDRPEDVEADPVSGRVYVALTNNSMRTADNLDKANPRAANENGQILELVPPSIDGKTDHGALEHAWDIFLLAGNPADGSGAWYPNSPGKEGWLSCPDNLTFDKAGRIWIATDGMTYRKPPISDGLFAADIQGPGRGRTRRFFSAPVGAEVCGPMLNPDNTTLFLCVQHPGDGDDATFYKPAVRWPDGGDMPPRPSVMAIRKSDGGVIGS